MYVIVIIQITSMPEGNSQKPLRNTVGNVHKLKESSTSCRTRPSPRDFSPFRPNHDDDDIVSFFLVYVGVDPQNGGLFHEVELVGRHLLQPELRLAADAPREVARFLLLRPDDEQVS